MLGGIGLELTWFQSILLGFLSGIGDILPISGEAHRLVAMRLFGNGVTMSPVVELFLHIGILCGLYSCCRNQIRRILRAQQLGRIPKGRRKRPLDTRTMMDVKLLKTTLIPIIVAFFFFNRAVNISDKLVLVSFFVLLNGIILYIPQYLPGSNKDARSLSPLEGLLIGLGGGFSIIPGISCMGAGISIATVCGADKKYAMNICLLMTIPVTVGMILMDILAIIGTGGAISFGLIFSCLLCAATAYAGVLVGIRLLRWAIENIAMSIFGFYCWSLSLFTFILYLTAA